MRLKLPDNQITDDGNMLKRRLLGAAVLIAVAVIALPLLLDGAGSESRFRRVEQLRQEPPRIINSAEKPQTRSASLPTPEAGPEAGSETTEPVAAPGALLTDTTEAATGAQPEQLAVAPEKPKTLPREPALEQEPVPEPSQAAAKPAAATAPSATVVDQVAWIVQAGSYSAEANALALRARLRAAGFPSFVSKGLNQGAAVFRVKVGPLNNRQQADKVQSEVESLLGQSTLIRKYP